ncbi:hypothetical protein AB0I82_35915 [Streptomyces sp. NPDC050315]|uniref:hypothetical protein n=1 Tax=Streptomyces sp. NPDC050315 TaxID=3155039 RepID=UPI0034456BEB
MRNRDAGLGELGGDEQVLVEARRRAMRLAVALVKEPFTAGTLAALRTYLSQYAEGAHAAFVALQRQPEAALLQRIDELSGGTAGSRS